MVCDCQGGISGVDIWIGTVHDCLIFTAFVCHLNRFIYPVSDIGLFGVHGYVTFILWCVIVGMVYPVLISGLVRYMTV